MRNFLYILLFVPLVLFGQTNISPNKKVKPNHKNELFYSTTINNKFDFHFNPEISLSKKEKCVGVFVQVLRDVIRDNQANMIANQELKKLR
jgi:hypothetical protein